MNVLSNLVDGVLHSAAPKVFEDLLAGYSRRDFRVRFWDGSSWGADDHPAFTLVVKDPGAARTLLSSPSPLDLAESYIADDLDVEGDMEAACDLGDYLLDPHHRTSPSHRLHLAGILQSLLPDRPSAGYEGPHLHGTIHSRRRDMEAIRYHYDLPPGFFALWLDRRMVYSCAYFLEGEEEDLETAQERKLDYICRKLRLRRGDRLLDIGCGWGGLLIYAAKRYGVLAQGITLSMGQADVARKRIRAAGLGDRCRVEICDYRDLESSRPFDKIVSVGMFEHVGEALLPGYFACAWNLLRPGGAFLNTGIASVPSRAQPKGPSFVDRYVFPDGELVPLSTTLAAAENSGFEVRDVESLREHYALTLRRWVSRLEARHDQARHITDEKTYRIWRLYMAGSAHQFSSGMLNLYQVLLAKPSHANSEMPLTRTDWY